MPDTEVMPVSGHEAALAKAKDKALNADIWREIHLERVKALEALLSPCPVCEGDFSGGGVDEPSAECSNCNSLGVVVPDLAKARKEGREEAQEALKPIHQILDLEIERCQKLGDVWAEEGIDGEFPANPEDRARFFHGQRDKLKELRADLLDSLTKGGDSNGG